MRLQARSQYAAFAGAAVIDSCHGVHLTAATTAIVSPGVITCLTPQAPGTSACCLHAACDSQEGRGGVFARERDWSIGALLTAPFSLCPSQPRTASSESVSGISVFGYRWICFARLTKTSLVPLFFDGIWKWWFTTVHLLIAMTYSTTSCAQADFSRREAALRRRRRRSWLCVPPSCRCSARLLPMRTLGAAGRAEVGAYGLQPPGSTDMAGCTSLWR